jgi:hypothetical protein
LDEVIAEVIGGSGEPGRHQRRRQVGRLRQALAVLMTVAEAGAQFAAAVAPG